MQVSRKAGARHASQIQADIKALGVQSLTVYNRQFREYIEAFAVFLARQILQVAGMSQGSNQQVPIVVGVTIENDEGRSAPGDNHELPIRRRSRLVFGSSA